MNLSTRPGSGPAPGTTPDPAHAPGTVDTGLETDGAGMETDDGDDREIDDGPGMTTADGRRGFGVITVALAILVGLLLGYAAGLLTPGLVRPGDASPEAGFARDMSTHHAQAIELAMLAHEKASDPDVRNLGADISLTQQAQIGMMQTWLKQWQLGPTGSQRRMAWMPEDDGPIPLRDGLMPGMATDAERAQLRAATGRDFDVLFLELMRRHHLGGIHMAEGVLELSDEEQVTSLAQSMVDGQKKEIALIRSLLTKLGATG